MMLIEFDGFLSKLILLACIVSFQISSNSVICMLWNLNWKLEIIVKIYMLDLKLT